MPPVSRRIYIGIITLLVLLAAAPSPAPAQTSPPKTAGDAPQDQPIRLKTDLIELRVVVTDKKGTPIGDLKKEEFELFENGRPQEIGFFSQIKIPGRGAAALTDTPNSTPATPGAPGPDQTPARSVVLFVDTLHLSTQSLLTIKQALRKFIDEKLTDQDLTSIVTSAGTLGVAEQFTRDRRILRYAVNRLSVRASTRRSLFTPYIAAMVDRGDPQGLQVAQSIYAAEERVPPNDPSTRPMVQARARQVLAEANYLRRSALITLREIVQRMADLPGQRLIILASDGFTLFDQGGTPDTSDLQSVVSRAVRSGVVIYSVDAKGLAPPSLFDASLGDVPNDPRISSYISSGERDLENGLNALARDTGGEPFFNTNDTVGAMGKALENNQLYYALAYYPAGEQSEKKFRKISIKIKNHPDYEVRAQRGYLPADLAKKVAEAEKLTPQQQFVNAILAPLPYNGLGVVATADYLEAPEDNAQATLQVHLDPRTLTLTEDNGRRRFDAEILTMIYDSDGKRIDVKSESLLGNLTPERMEVVKQQGFTYTRRLQLKPGVYQVRIGVREPNHEKIGTAAVWIETPDLSKKKLTPSSLFLTDPTALTDPAVGAQTAPQSRVVGGLRYYRAGQPMVYLLRLYNAIPNDQTETDAQLQIEIWREDQRISLAPWLPAASRLIGKDAKGLIVGGQLGLENFQPGVYELRISVKSAKVKRPIERSVSFGVDQ